MRGRLQRFLLILYGTGLVMGGVGCASSETNSRRTSTEPAFNYEASRADAAAFGSIDGFTFGKSQEIRPANNYEFYYKECGLTAPDETRAFFSKTEYACSPSPLD